MENLQRIIVACLFVAVVAIIVVTGVQTMKTKEAQKGPGPQVPALEMDSKSRIVESNVENSSGSTSVALQEGGGTSSTSVACTADAQICPGGASVGREGPDCEFAPCPHAITVSKLCTATQKKADACTMEYAPVCGLVQVQCVTTPCNPVPETFGNACSACAQGNVGSYSEGECLI